MSRRSLHKSWSRSSVHVNPNRKEPQLSVFRQIRAMRITRYTSRSEAECKSSMPSMAGSGMHQASA